ncbi:MAG: chloride channel protein [Alphaproteobacteria bacterium]
MKKWAAQSWDQVVQAIAPNLARFLISRQPTVWLLAVAIGILVGYIAIGFHNLIGLVQLPWLGTGTQRVAQAAAELPFYVVLLVPAAGGLVVGLFLTFIMPSRRVETVADVIEARAMKGGKMNMAVGVGSALTSAFSLGIGASAGREGPVVHLGATLGAWAAGLLKLPPRATRTLLGCGVAAAIGASFNAPIAGILFAIEVILGHYTLAAFVPIVIAGVAATVISRVHIGDYPAFTLPDYTIVSNLEFPAFALLGVACAVVAVIFMAATMKADQLATRISMPLWLRPTLGGLIIGAIAVFLPQVLGVGYGVTDAALHQQIPLAMLAVLLVAKLAATAITLASRFGGGIFSPSLYLGAMTGGVFGIIAAATFPQLASGQGLYSLIGMGGVAAAVLGAPISTTLIIFELTGGFKVAVALLITVSISAGLTYAMLGRNFFHWQLETRGITLTGGTRRAALKSIRVGDFMTGEIAQASAAQPGEPRLTRQDTLETALQLFDEHGVSKIIVIDAQNPLQPIGTIDKVAALDTFNQALMDNDDNR